MRLARHVRASWCAGLLVSLVALVAGVHVVDGLGMGFLYLAPAVALVLPLLAGRFVGADRLIALGAARLRQRRRAAPALAPTGRRASRAVVRGGRLVACCMARRGPPARLRTA
jgi:hypothetical protein